MATDDQSMATLTENWIVTTIQGIQVGDPAADVFVDTAIAPWYGSIAESAQAASDELLGGERSPIVRVRFLRDIAEPLEAGFHRLQAVYEVIVGVQHARARGEARRGDGTVYGVNGLRDFLVNALDNKRPGITANSRATDKTAWTGSDCVWNDRKSVIMVCGLTVHEVPTT